MAIYTSEEEMISAVKELEKGDQLQISFERDGTIKATVRIGDEPEPPHNVTTLVVAETDGSEKIAIYIKEIEGSNYNLGVNRMKFSEENQLIYDENLGVPTELRVN